MLLSLENESETIYLGAIMANILTGGELVYLQGELGAGKTTFVRGLLNALGYLGNVKSPTYTLVEPYLIAGIDVYHFDLYRINDPGELEAMGIRDYCDGKSICLFEWAEKGASVLRKSDITLLFSYHSLGREVEIKSNSIIGKKILEFLKKTYK
ncbi:MAG: tRNA (adenosine(37)-N6)-threonylcarbamoyltransferase complex ATPase subunit type 1 TsaE [Legionellales bacterium]|nr:tRNA (adenosine(37)-N6)-threonylcarbamoyltransferase complex ATPase subunit type 1 TsaE [Legionellales bacterium]